MCRRFAISWVLLLLALPGAARTRPHYGGTLRVEIEGDPWQKPNGIARPLVFDGLTARDSDGMVRPALATEWASADGDHRWQFHLRPGVRFHDGTPLTATNAAAALNVACPAHCPWSAIQPVGAWLVFTGDAPMPNLPALLAGDEFLIMLTMGGEGKTPNPDVGTGPFQVSTSANGALALTANENCWQGRPFVDAIEIRAHRSIHDQWLDLGVGRADLAEVPAEMVRQAQQQRLTVIASPSAELLALQESDTGALANPQIRAAIAAAVDRSALSNVIFQKQGEVTGSLLPQAVTGLGFLFPTDRDLNRAHELRGGLTVPPLALSTDGDGAMQLAAQRIALNLREAGFNVQTGNALRPDLELRKLPLAVASPPAVLDELLRSAGQPSPAASGADLASLFKAEREVLDRHTLVPLLDLPRAYAVGVRLRDLRIGADGLPNLADVSLEDAP
ncbi:MAG TPA: ABC transporter substrate-binding protein [Terracidiphilus sp.]|nr:ABC transporter substrate-binding protein [Terracidiphilus sp.]